LESRTDLANLDLTPIMQREARSKLIQRLDLLGI
jgi:hypothetical protein